MFLMIFCYCIAILCVKCDLLCLMPLGGERVAVAFGWGTIRSLQSIPCGGVAVGACGGCEGWQSRVGLRSIEFWPRPDPPRTTPARMTSCARFSRHAYRPHRPVAFASLIRSGNGLLWRKQSCPVVVLAASSRFCPAQQAHTPRFMNNRRACYS